MLTGENGILNRASEANEKTSISQKQERLELSNMEEIINDNINGTNVEKVTDGAPGTLEKESDDVYVINSIEDLVFFSYDVRNGNTYNGKNVRLGIDLDFNSNKSYVEAFRMDYGKYGYNGELKTLLTEEQGFLPIGNYIDDGWDINEETNFSGTFDGAGHKILNLYMNVKKDTLSGNSLFYGLFAGNIGTIQNLYIKECNIAINTNSKGQRVGIITGNNKKSIINCTVSGKVTVVSTGWNSTGGIAGISSGTIKNSSNRANIKSSRYSNDVSSGVCLGGIAGGDSSLILNDVPMKVEKCINSGKIEAETNENNSYIGGITATSQNGTKIIESCNNGDLSYKGKGGIYIGGITGSNMYKEEAKIQECFNIGAIKVDNEGSNIMAGGISGYNYQSGEILNSYNISEIKIKGISTQEVEVGGIVGLFIKNRISNCYSVTEISDEVDSDNKMIGIIIGKCAENTNVNNIFYSSSENYEGIGMNQNINYTEDESKKTVAEIKEIYNILGEKFALDANNINKGFPILIWQ